MNRYFESNAGVAAVRQTDIGHLFSEIGLSATFFDSMPMEIVLVGETGEFLAANDSFRSTFGDPPGRGWKNLLINDLSSIDLNLKTVFERGSHSFKVSYDSPTETARDYHIDAFKLQGNTPRAALIHRKSNQSESTFWFPPENKPEIEVPGISAQRFGFYERYETADVSLISIDADRNIRFANDAARKLLDTGSTEMTGLNIGTFLSQENGHSQSTKTPNQNNYSVALPDGTNIWLDIREVPVFENETLLVLNDISEKKIEESELRSAYELYRIFVSQSDHEVFRFDLTNTIKTEPESSDAAISILDNAFLASLADSPAGFTANEIDSNLVGTTFGAFFGSRESSLEVARQFVSGGYKLFKKEILESSEDGHESFFNTNIVGVVENKRLVRIWLSRRDITIRKQAEKAYLMAEDQLRQSQKIEPIGRLAGGIAHDFNNFLAVIMLQIEMMNQELEDSSPLRRRVGEIKIVADKAANMVKQLLAFGRKQTMQPHNVNLNEVLEEFIKMTASLIGEDIEIEVDTEPDLGVCFVDQNQITQILMNLAINSRDAMPEGGKLKITTANLSIDENTFKHRAQPKGKYIELTVEDNGIGMEPATKKHVFEPFFTTKEGHKGTGLGLATVYGIVKQSKGFIWVDSKIGEGTCFKVQFPRVDRTSSVIKPKKVTSIPRGTETILLVEDEEQIRKTSVEVLSSLGYNILEASDGEDAIKIASEFDRDIHLLLTDVVMPRINGRELAKQVKSSHPELTVLFMSGYADDIITRHGILEEDVHFLGKPFSPLTLAVKVRDVIGE